MGRHISLQPHLTVSELEQRYRAAKEPHERSWWQILWLLAQGHPATELAGVTGYSAYWIGQVAKRYNDEGPAGMQNRQHTTSRRMAPLEWPHGGRVDERAAGPTGLALPGLDLLEAPQTAAAPRRASATPCAGRSPRARHLQKKLRPLLRAVATAFPHAQVEVWATDEHRIGLKPLLRRVWSPAGPRPHALVQRRFAWRWLVGFVHPASGRTFFHLASTVSIELFAVELAAFAEQAGAGPDKQIVLVLDQAGWHTSVRLQVPEHVHLLFLPPYSPELQPAEHLWQLTNTVLINRHFADLDELKDAQARRCVALQQRRDLIRSATRFPWWPLRIKKRQGPRTT